MDLHWITLATEAQSAVEDIHSYFTKHAREHNSNEIAIISNDAVLGILKKEPDGNITFFANYAESKSDILKIKCSSDAFTSVFVKYYENQKGHYPADLKNDEIRDAIALEPIIRQLIQHIK